MRNRTVAYFLHYPGAGSRAAVERSKVRSRISTVTGSDFSSGLGEHRCVFPNSASHGGSAAGVCISRIVTPRDRSPFNAGKMGAGRTKAREILHARHDFPHCCRKIQLLIANPSACAG